MLRPAPAISMTHERTTAPGDSTAASANDATRSAAELARALGQVPAYAPWSAFDPGPDVEVDSRYRALPATTNAWIRAEGPDRFVPVGTDIEAEIAAGRVERILTSGTTGPPTPLLFSQSWWDASERASWLQHPVLAAVATGLHAEAVLASARCVGPGFSERPLSAEQRTLGRLLFVNEHADVARWTEATVRRMVRELEDHAPVVLEADPFYLAELCARAEALRLALPRPRVVVLTYALPSRLHLGRIVRALEAPIVSSYGSTESGYVLVSCEAGRMHQCSASCRLDLQPARERVAPRVAKLLVTPYANPFACFLRFDVGDLGRLADSCPCGRRDGVILERLEGRVKDCTVRSDAGLVTAAQLDDAVAAVPSANAIVSYQLEQAASAEVTLRVTAAGPIDAGAIAASLRETYGATSPIRVEVVAALVPESSGKYAASRSRIEVDPRTWFLPLPGDP